MTEAPLPSLGVVSEESQDFRNTFFLCILLLAKTTRLFAQLTHVRKISTQHVSFYGLISEALLKFFWSILE